MDSSEKERKDGISMSGNSGDQSLTFLESLKLLMSHSLRMQIFFYLITFQELSLSELALVLQKPKTTVHHHVRFLEKKKVLISREVSVKNFKEKIYSLNPTLVDLIQDQGTVMKESEGYDAEFSLTHMIHAVRAFSAFILSIMERFATLMEIEGDHLKETFTDSFFMILIKPKDTYLEIIEKIKEIMNSEDNTSESQLDEDTWVITLSGTPYGMLFQELISSRRKKDNR